MKSEILRKSLQVKKNLTYPQRKFIAGVVSGLTPTQASKEAYPTATYGSQRSMATENLKKPKVKSAIEKALTKHNISEDRITGLINEALETDTPDTIDWNTKHNYIKTVLQLKGYLNKDNNSNNTNVNIGLSLD